MLTDVKGVLDATGELLSYLTLDQANELIAEGTISGGMIPKVETCLDAVKSGAGAANDPRWKSGACCAFGAFHRTRYRHANTC